MKTLLLALVVLLSGCASVGRDRAVNAHLSDIGSTAVALAAGGVEMNPLGWVALPLKALQMRIIAAEPEPTVRAEAYIQVAAVTNGVSANNVCIAISLIFTLGLAVPVCPSVGVAWGAYDYHQQMDPEKFYQAFCEEWKKEKPGNTCAPYVPPNGDRFSQLGSLTADSPD